MGAGPEVRGDSSALAAGERSVWLRKAVGRAWPQRPQRLFNAAPKPIPKVENGCLDHRLGLELSPLVTNPHRAQLMGLGLTS